MRSSVLRAPIEVVFKLGVRAAGVSAGAMAAGAVPASKSVSVSASVAVSASAYQHERVSMSQSRPRITVAQVLGSLRCWLHGVASGESASCRGHAGVQSVSRESSPGATGSPRSVLPPTLLGLRQRARAARLERGHARLGLLRAAEPGRNREAPGASRSVASSDVASSDVASVESRQVASASRPLRECPRVRVLN
jgi:hypothetical protein